MAVTYTTLTVGRSGGPAFTVGRTSTAAGLTVTRGTTAALTVLGHGGAIVGGFFIDLAFLTEAGDYLALETGELLLTA